MGQFMFFALFIIAILAGAFAYFAPAQRVLNPLKFVMENSGYNSTEQINTKKVQTLNLTMEKGLLKVRRQMDNFEQEQKKILDMIEDQRQALKNAGKEASDVMLEAQQAGQSGDKDILKLKSLSLELQDEQRLLVAHGQDLLVLNDQLTKNRQWIADQIDASNINNETSLSMLQQHYALLNDQANKFFDGVMQHNQEVRDQMEKLQDQLHDLANNTASDSSMQEQTSKERIQRMLDKEHEDMQKLADSEERSRNAWKDAQENLTASKDLFNDSLQHTQELIEEERQKAQDQQWLNQQRVAEQEQRMQDLQNK